MKIFYANARATVGSLMTGALMAAAHSHSPLHSHHHDHASHHDHHHHDRDLEVTKRCGASDPTGLDVHEQVKARDAFQKSVDSGNYAAVKELTTVPVCFHVIQNDAGDVEVTEEMLQEQLRVLNEAFSSTSCCNEEFDWCEPGSCSIETGIRFAFAVLDETGEDVVEGSTVSNLNDKGACVTRTNQSLWREINLFDDGLGFDLASIEMKAVLHKGDARVANVYFNSLVGILGYSTFPWGIAGAPTQDGILISTNTLPGGVHPRYDSGRTLVHEMGHWLGLLHTFAGECSGSEGIIDTAPEREPYIGCGDIEPLERDTCPNDNLADPVHNFMNYSDDDCLYYFTPGQTFVMNACYDIFRRGLAQSPPTITLEKGDTSQPVFLLPTQEQVFQIEVTSSVACTVTKEEGLVEMYMSWDKAVQFSDEEACGIGETKCWVGYYENLLFNIWPFSLLASSVPRPLYVGVKAISGASVPDLTLSCR